jgi:holo-[acyl-carrier protein] synthase
MIIGIGVDVVDVARFEETLARTPALRERLFCESEQGLVEVRSLAARFAAKEAVAKALGAPAGLVWRDAEVVTDDGGAPSLVLRGTVRARAEALGASSAHLSLSHDAGVAVAFVVMES